jgi:hypothetical protein
MHISCLHSWPQVMDKCVMKHKYAPKSSYHIPLLMEKGLQVTSSLGVYSEGAIIHCIAVCKIQCHLWKAHPPLWFSLPVRYGDCTSQVELSLLPPISLWAGQCTDLDHTQSLCPSAFLSAPWKSSCAHIREWLPLSFWKGELHAIGPHL